MTLLGNAPGQPTSDLVQKVEKTLAKRAVRWHKPSTGLTAAQRFIVDFEDGTSAFVKAAVDSDTERWLRTDHLIMSTFDADLVPKVIAWIEAGTESVLIIEDLRDAYWPADHSRQSDGATQPVRWELGQFELLFAALERLATTPAPDGLPPLSDLYEPQWPEIADNPQPFLSLGLCTGRWLDASLDRLLAAEQDLDLSGAALVHNDIRSDNVCFKDDRVILVDWSNARRGSPQYDKANLLSLAVLEGGPDPYVAMPQAGSFAAWRGAEFARRVIYQTDAPDWLLRVFRRGAIINLQWATKSLALPAWEGPDWLGI